MSDDLKRFINGICASDDKLDNLNMLKKLSDMLLLEKFNDSFLVCLELLSNYDNINSVVGSVVNENMDLIVKNKFSSIYSNKYFNSFIEVYCMNNNIEIESDNSIDYGLSYCDDYFYKSIKDIPVLTREEEQQLFKLYNSADSVISNNARKQLIRSNLRLVFSIASKYKKHSYYEDIVSEGNIGLMKAVSNFDVSKGYKFSTYAVWWIRQSINRYFYNYNSVIKIPIGFKTMIISYDRFINEWKEQYGVTPSLEEIMVGTGFSSDDISLIQKYINGIASLESPIGEEEDTFLIDLVPDLSVSVEDSFDERYFISSLFDIFKEINLDDRDIDIIVMRLGLDGRGERTLEEIALKYNITRERVRQKVAKILIKIRRYKSKAESDDVMTK